jgi:hypothetical protein
MTLIWLPARGQDTVASQFDSFFPKRDQVARQITVWNDELRSVQSAELIADTPDFRDFIQRGFESELRKLPERLSRNAEKAIGAHAEILIRLSAEGISNLDESLAVVEVESTDAESFTAEMVSESFTYDFVYVQHGPVDLIHIAKNAESQENIPATLKDVVVEVLLPSANCVWIATVPVINRTGVRGEFTTVYVEKDGGVKLSLRSGYVFSPAVGSNLYRKPKEWFPWETVAVGTDVNGKPILQLGALQTDSQQQTHESIITKANQSAGTSYGKLLTIIGGAGILGGLILIALRRKS